MGVQGQFPLGVVVEGDAPGRGLGKTHGAREYRLQHRVEVERGDHRLGNLDQVLEPLHLGFKSVRFAVISLGHGSPRTEK